MKHCAEARRALRSLDEALARAAKQAGQELFWTPVEVEAREALATTMDRRARVKAVCEQVVDPELLVKLSAEIRQLDAAVIRLVKEIKPEAPPVAESRTTIKARNAVNVRWARERNHG